MIEVRGVHLNERHPWKVREWSPGTGGIQALAFHKRQSGREEERRKLKEKGAGHISMLAIKIHNLITHFFTIPSIKPFNQLRHFNRINSIVFFSHTQCSSGLSLIQENCFVIVDLKKVDGSQNNAYFSLLDSLFLLLNAGLRQTVFSANGITQGHFSYSTESSFSHKNTYLIFQKANHSVIMRKKRSNFNRGTLSNT